MAEAAARPGLEYIAITDHSQSLAMANGLDERRALAHAARIRARRRRSAGVRLLAGIECDIRPDGTLDLADDCLAALDLVVASVHSAFNQDRQQMTDRVLRAIENPHVDILGHLTGRLILRREPYAIDVEAIVDAAARHGVAIEINCQVDRLDLNDVHARLARDRGVPLVISSDAHSRQALGRAALGRRRRAPRLARAGARAEHAAVRGVQGGPSPQPAPLTVRSSKRMIELLKMSDDPTKSWRRSAGSTSRRQADDPAGPRDRALDLLKSMTSEEERERATVYMEGLAQMRSDWAAGEETKSRRRGKGEEERPSSSTVAFATIFLRAAIRSGSGTLRSIASICRSRSFRRGIMFSDMRQRRLRVLGEAEDDP